MSLFSKWFASSDSGNSEVEIPNEASPGEVIQIAVQSLFERTGINCATIEVTSNRHVWIQIMDCVINCHYPHQENPWDRYLDLCKLPLIAGVDDFEPETSMTVSLKEMNVPEIQSWIGRYFSEVLQLDAEAIRLTLKLEQL
jgi:hypothetical protein